MDDSTALALFTDSLTAAAIAPTTIRLRLYYLGRLAEHLAGVPLLHADRGQLVAFLARRGWSPETRKSARATLRVFYSWAADEGLVDVDPAARIRPVHVPNADPRPTPLKVVAEALMRATPTGRRALLLARYSGLRRAEVAGLHTDDLTEVRDRHGVVRPAVRVRRETAKGSKVRVVPLHPRVAEAIAGLPRGWVFSSTRTPSGHMSPDSIGDLVSDLLGPGWTMHTLRHRAASDWYAVDRDIRAVQRLLGHASVATTQTYTAVPPDAELHAVLGVA